MARNCPTASVPVSFVHSGGRIVPFYTIPLVAPATDFRPPARPSHPVGGILHEFDMKDIILGDDYMPLLLQFAMTQSYREKEVFEVDRYSGDKLAQIGCLRSLSSTMKGQQLLTV